MFKNTTQGVESVVWLNDISDAILLQGVEGN